MRYMLLIFSDPNQGPPPASPEAMAEMMRPWGEYTQALKDAGVYVGGDALQGPDTATSVRGDVVTDGPFAETKEQLGGFYMLDCKDLDEALEFAAKIPSLPMGGSVEVRPIMEIENAG